jgi:hypothetical protein
MAARTLVVTTPSLTGTSVVSASSALASLDTCVISCTTAQGVLDTNTLFLRCTNTNSTISATLTLYAGINYSEVGQGNSTITIATAETVIVGGQGFESARFVGTAQAITLLANSSGPTTIEAYQAPNAFE